MSEKTNAAQVPASKANQAMDKVTLILATVVAVVKVVACVRVLTSVVATARASSRVSAPR